MEAVPDGIAHVQTKGLLHPNALGHLNYANHIFEHLQSLLPPAPQATPPQFMVSDTNSTGNTATDPAGTTTVTSTEGAHGWLVGRSPTGGTACPSGCDRVVSQIVATAASGTTIRRAGLTINGTAVDCGTGAGLPAGVTCQQTLTGGDQLYKWSLQFRHDGIYKLNATVTGEDDSVGSTSHDVKVDLHDPRHPEGSPSSANPPTNGWYRGPVTVTFDIADPDDGGTPLEGSASPASSTSSTATPRSWSALAVSSRPERR